MLIGRAAGERGRGRPACDHLHPARPGARARSRSLAESADPVERELELLAGIAQPGAARDHERRQLRDARAHVPLDRRGARERARGEGRVHVVARALDLRHRRSRSGRELGLDAVQLKRVELGALFHDIGKIGIPASILMKPGPLTAEERSMIEQHPELGERILAPIEQLAGGAPDRPRAATSATTARGYPDGLAADEIPLEARIIFACDAFHAMTTDRPYREALPVEEALRRLAQRRRHAVRPGRRRGLPARAEAAAAARPTEAQLPDAARSTLSARSRTGTASRARSVVPFGGSSGSAVQSSCAQRRPKRVGGRTNVTGSRHALKRTMNESSATGSPSASASGSRRRSGRRRARTRRPALQSRLGHPPPVGPEPPDVRGRRSRAAPRR